jgi:hypothetical protein
MNSQKTIVASLRLIDQAKNFSNQAFKENRRNQKGKLTEAVAIATLCWGEQLFCHKNMRVNELLLMTMTLRTLTLQSRRPGLDLQRRQKREKKKKKKKKKKKNTVARHGLHTETGTRNSGGMVVVSLTHAPQNVFEHLWQCCLLFFFSSTLQP